VGDNIPAFNKENFADALVEWFCEADLSFNSIENQRLHRIFQMLRPGLHDSDIPHRQSLRDRALAIWEDHLETMSTEMKVWFNLLL
jgi:hypothetical protein